jgi:hypothetical protein
MSRIMLGQVIYLNIPSSQTYGSNLVLYALKLRPRIFRLHDGSLQNLDAVAAWYACAACLADILKPRPSLGHRQQTHSTLSRVEEQCRMECFHGGNNDEDRRHSSNWTLILRIHSYLQSPNVKRSDVCNSLFPEPDSNEALPTRLALHHKDSLTYWRRWSDSMRCAGRIWDSFITLRHFQMHLQ